MSEHPETFRAGAWVEIKSWPAILATLDARGCRDDMPFMPEMLAYCGKKFQVLRRVEKTCVEGDRMRRLRRMVYLGNLRCTGRNHGGCDRECRLFWHDDWLVRAGVQREEATTHGPAFPFPVNTDDRYICQSTELVRSSSSMSRMNVAQYVRDVLNKTWRAREMIQFLRTAVSLRVRAGRMSIGSLGLFGVRDATETQALQLRPGDLVETKSAGEIAATLDRRGRNRGLAFPVYMLPFCGKTFRVRRPVQRIILETTGQLRALHNTVSLECASCNGHGRWGGCPRDQFHLWREIWLNRVESVTASDDQPPQMLAHAPVEQLDDPAWDEYASQHPDGTIFHLSGWRRALEATYPHIRGMFYGLHRNGRGILAGIPAYIVDSRFLGRKVVCAPFATKCGPLISGDVATSSLDQFFMAILRATGARHFELKANFMEPQELGDLRLAAVRAYKHHAIPLSPGPDEIMRHCSRTNVRQRIRRAQEAGLAVIYAHDDDSVRHFHRMFMETRRRLGLPAMQIQFFRNLIRFLPAGAVRLSLVCRGSEPIAGLFALRYRGTLHYEHMGYREEAAGNGGNQLLWWDGIVRACEEGLHTVSLGCTAADNEGLLAYKRHWGANEEDVTTAATMTADRSGSAASLRAIKDRSITRWIFRNAPDPVYRLLSSGVYQHWG